jgi:hypothetical protein
MAIVNSPVVNDAVLITLPIERGPIRDVKFSLEGMSRSDSLAAQAIHLAMEDSRSRLAEGGTPPL